MIYFKKIRYKNLLSTGNVFTELDLDSHNTTLIVGENGAGKSTVLDALSYVLFGKAFRKINKPQLLNSITQKGLCVEIEFNISSNEYKIIRGMRPNIFEVYMNGVLLNQSAEMKDYQEILEKQILKVNHKSFCQVVVLGSATFQPFMQLPTGQRRAIIEDLLDLQIFTTMNTLLKNKINDNAEAVYKVAADKRLIEEKIKLIKQHLQEIQSNNEQLKEEKNAKIKVMNEQLGLLVLEEQRVDAVIKSMSDQIKDEESVSKKMKQLSSLKHQIEANMNLLNKEVEFFNKHDDCPTCKQPIALEFKCEAIKDRETQVTEIKDGLEKLVTQYDELNSRISEIMKIHTTINDNKMESNRLKTRINNIQNNIENLEDEIKGITKKSKDIDDSKIPELEKELTQISLKSIDLNEQKHLLAVAGTLLKDGGIKSRIVKQYVPIINKLINKYLSAMEFMCQFELDENFNETIKSRYRDEFTYDSFSEGEKMRINLAILFTWRALAKMRNSISTNLLIMDEVFDSSLDSTGTDEFLKIINNLTSDTNTFIISHKSDQLSDKFERIIRFEKHKNFSKVAA